MSVERSEPATTEVATRGFFRDLTVASIASGLVAFLFAAGAKEVVRIEGASHVVMISHPDALVKLIDHAAAHAAL